MPLESGTWSVRPVLLSTSFENGHLHLERKWNKNGGRIICKQGSALSGTKLYIARCQSEAFRTIRYACDLPTVKMGTVSGNEVTLLTLHTVLEKSSCLLKKEMCSSTK